MAVDRTKEKKPAMKLIKPNLGIEDAGRNEVCEILNARLSDVFTLYTKTRKYHWNVRGKHFGQLHELFEEQYTELEEEIDKIAERVRQLGGLAVGTLDEFKSLTQIEEQPGYNPNDIGMIRGLLNDHEMIIRSLREDIDTAEAAKDTGTADFLTACMEDHEKMAWMLRAHLEENDSSD